MIEGDEDGLYLHEDGFCRLKILYDGCTPLSQIPLPSVHGTAFAILFMSPWCQIALRRHSEIALYPDTRLITNCPLTIFLPNVSKIA